MQIKRYEARNMRDGLEQVKSDLGAEAIILSAKNVKSPAEDGKAKPSMVEIIAARDRPEWFESGASRDDLWDPASQLEPMREEIRDLKDTVSRIAFPRIPLPPNFDRVFQEMVFQGVRYELALRLTLEALDELKVLRESEGRGRKEVIASVVRRIPDPQPISLGNSGKPEVVALVGPTGVGKTTTLAKLAAAFAVRSRKKVAILTNDSYRIAAIEQLKVYGKILDVPVEPVESSKELGRALTRLRDVDLILIDTAGRSHRDRFRIEELKRFFCGFPVTKHLVLSCHTKERDLEEVVARFRGLDPDRLIFTKLDEATTFGTILNVAFSSALPLSYFTIGQKVPEDIREARAEILCGLIFSGGVPRQGAKGPASNKNLA